ncbi:MAG TPA: sterol desaturase family protein [Chitinophagaceae bacterium]|jgi:sterol desaturase/sphingolipid hydroxylase (fatty acid hydroxylase superfamily)|nr:sterol desaturase family protein [Chitinophagaceae bacterium]
MKLNWLAFAVPLFLFFIGLEYFYSKRKGKNFFQYAESVANLNVGIAERLMDVFMTGVFFFVFDYIHKHFGLLDINAGPITWIALFLLTDLVWYWYHRLAHEINLFWSVHVVHHQSEDFNYTVSARITVFQAAVRCMFWCVLPLIGFPAVMVVGLLLVHGLYPFFIHTQAMGKWGFLEKFMVTPTHHGIHHASNPEYLDKNYGDVLIIWDKLFGTFAKEQKGITIEYGLTKQLKSHSFLWQHFHFPLELYMNFKYAKGWRSKWKAIFGKPDGLDPRYRSILERRLLNVQPHRKPTPAMRQYVTAQTIFSLVLLFIVALFEHYFSGLQLFLLSSFIIISLINSGAILDQRRWIFFLEFLRALIVMTEIGLFYRNNWTLSCLIALLLIMIWYFRPIQRKYIEVLYNG